MSFHIGLRTKVKRKRHEMSSVSGLKDKREVNETRNVLSYRAKDKRKEKETRNVLSVGVKGQKRSERNAKCPFI